MKYNLIVFKLNNQNIKISLSYITNFKPTFFPSLKNFKFYENRNNKKIISKNFFLFLLLLKYINKDNNLNVGIFIKPFYKKIITILRAPYRHKLSRNQLILKRYSLVCLIKINYNGVFIKNLSELIFLVRKLKKFYAWFESNLVYLHRSLIIFSFFYNKNFILNDFKKNNFRNF